MGARRLRALAGAAVGAAALAALAGGCGRGWLSHAVARSVKPLTPLTPSVTPPTVPGLDRLTFGTFPATWGGKHALQLCEDWAGLRGEYVTRVQAGDSPDQLERWFSAPVWQPAFSASSRLQSNLIYARISLAFGMATTGDSASVAAAERLDKACAAAD